MKSLATYAGWGLAALGVMLSPVAMIFGIPLLVGIGLDIFDLAGEVPVALALSLPMAFVLLRRVPPCRRIAAVLRSRLHPGRAGALDYAPKSIS